ncbi:MAG TPA: hypothetical protein ENO21_04545 [Firmicutes bacterium]|nr:hypothetical protein [Bacillota bacterium]
MSDKHEVKLDQQPEGPPPRDTALEVPELYEEPPKMTVKDTVGVIVALLALFVIGWLGYLWLTPGRSLADAWLFGAGTGDTQTTMQEMRETQMAADGADVSAARCASCGMFADRSMSHVKATFGDGSAASFDSWGCVFDYAEENNLALASAQVIDLTSSLEDPHWLDADSAAYLYGVDSVAGSMPPFIAAFPDEQTARVYIQQMGGELMDFAELLGKWPVQRMQMAGGELAHDQDMDAQKAAGARAEDREMETMAEQPGEQAQAADAASPTAIDLPHLHDHEMRCASCGMFTDRSMSQVVGYWTDGSETHHDCWDCLFNYAADNGLALDYALAKLYRSSLAEPEWIRAEQAVYLFGTAPIKGSMPPFAAAFSSRSAAEQAQSELGGEIMQFNDLKGNWE